VMAIYFMYKAMTHLDSAIVSVLGATSALFVVLLATFFFGETLSMMQIGGIGLLLPCLWYVLHLARYGKKMLDFHDQSWLRGFVFMMISSFLLAFAHVVEKEIFVNSSVGTYVAYGWLLQMIIAWALYCIFGRHAKKIFKSNKIVRSALQLGAFRAGAGLFFILALVKSDSVSLVTVIANFRIVCVAVLAGWILNERQDYYKKLVAAGISVVALSVIFWN
ncbi:EamA family transporter, partial [Candidatus Saccharibacteria bacterium]|nr:EamA family transporter [Candidatus Saccharibacteria bacterium]